MGLRIITLSENAAAGPYLLAEWGLSFLIESEPGNFLFDAGQGQSASHNADILGVSLAGVHRVILSHGHFDHTGGLYQILPKAGKRLDIVAHPDVWAAKYRRNKDGSYRYIGIPFVIEELERLGANFRFSREPVELTDSIMTTGEIPMTTEYEDIEPDMMVKEGGGWRADPLLDDQALIIRTGAGLAVVLGCAHRGIINTLRHARELTGEETVHTVMGGAHLKDAAEDRVRLTISALREFGVQRLGLSHCTGERVTTILAQEFGEGFFFNHAGTITDLEAT